MDHGQADAFLGALIRIADALEGIDSTLSGINDALREWPGDADGN